MLLSTFLLFLPSFLAAAVAATSETITYETVRGFFAQDLDETDAAGFDYKAQNFGVLTPWPHFTRSIAALNAHAPHGTRYVVLFLARHGEGWHNVAESYYGKHLWDCYWSMRDGNGTSVWADAALTPTGSLQARSAHTAWQTQLSAGAPLPRAFYTSPLSRAASTHHLTWSNTTTHAPTVLEALRETLGIHTCDRRRPRSALAADYPGFRFERGFAEEDGLWDPVLREPDAARRERVREALDAILGGRANGESGHEERGGEGESRVKREKETYIAISAHGGVIGSVLEVLGHRNWPLGTGAMVPVVVKVRVHAAPTATATTTVAVPTSATAPACTVAPTAADALGGGADEI
ncbi:phosphoglycerate mutase [Geopyxis carbonaria]|nr:phosphoglycerate mutase [Geopyxis carbonaria]